jgi:hypothetical protein
MKASLEEDDPDADTSGEAFASLVKLVQFTHANSSETLESLGNMTIPQVEILADAIHKFKITALGIGLGGKDGGADKSAKGAKSQPTSDSTPVGAGWAAGFSAIG